MDDLQNPNPEILATLLSGVLAAKYGTTDLESGVKAVLADGQSYQRQDLQARLLRAYHDLYPEAEVFSLERALHPVLLEVREDGNLPSWLEEGCPRGLLRKRIHSRIWMTMDARVKPSSSRLSSLRRQHFRESATCSVKPRSR